jgi:hypothetical protein
MIAYSGSAQSADAMRRFVQMRPWPDAAVQIVTFERDAAAADDLLHAARDYCHAHDMEVELLHGHGSARTQLLTMAKAGHLGLERQLQLADVAFQQHKAGERSFQERRQRTYETLREAGLQDVQVETRLVQRQAPLDAATQRYLQTAIFDRSSGPRIRDHLSEAEWALRCALCDAESPDAVLKRPDYYCLYPVTLFRASV